MLGYGCSWKNVCKEYARASAGWKKNFCNSDTGCDKCSYRPKNTGNKEMQRQNANFKRNESDVNTSWIFILIVAAALIYFKFF